MIKSTITLMMSLIKHIMWVNILCFIWYSATARQEILLFFKITAVIACCFLPNRTSLFTIYCYNKVQYMWWYAAGNRAVLDWEFERASKRTAGKDCSHWQHVVMDQGRHITTILLTLTLWIFLLVCCCTHFDCCFHINWLVCSCTVP